MPTRRVVAGRAPIGPGTIATQLPSRRDPKVRTALRELLSQLAAPGGGVEPSTLQALLGRTPARFGGPKRREARPTVLGAQIPDVNIALRGLPSENPSLFDNFVTRASQLAPTPQNRERFGQAILDLAPGLRGLERPTNRGRRPRRVPFHRGFFTEQDTLF